MNKLFKLFFTTFFIVFLFIACDKDYNTLGSDIVSNEHFDFNVKDDYTISVENKAITAMQSNNLPINPLGIYKDPFFGKTTAHFASQISLSSTYSEPNTTIGYKDGATNTINIQTIDSVYMYVPYFSNVKSTESDGTKTYTLDSLYQSTDEINQKFKLEIYENNAYLGNDGMGTDPRYYYNTSSEYNRIDSQKGEKLAEVTDFKFSKDEIKLYKRKKTGEYLDSSGNETNDPTKYVVKERMTPGMWINITNKNFFLNKVLLAAHEGKLINNSTFQQHLKGLFFKVTDNTSTANALSLLNFSQGYIVVQYHSKLGSTLSAANTAGETKNVLRLNLTGNTVSVSQFEPSIAYSNGLTGAAATNGEKIYIKGGNGSVSYLNAISDTQLTQLRAKDANGNRIMVNEANLIFHVDNSIYNTEDKKKTQKHPLRIYLYDATNNIPILDYNQDGSTTTNNKYNKYFFGGIVETQNTTYTDEKGNTIKNATKYKINITQYIRNLINIDTDANGDGTVNDDDAKFKRVKLGLVVTENINIANNYYEQGVIGAPISTYTKIPLGSAISPFGTVLHGPNSTATDASGNPLKLKLQIHYTKPE